MSFDLHVHSNRSDGAFPPAEVVRRAKTVGLEGIALTDHDTLDGYEEATTAGRELGLEVLPGCEVSTSHNDGPVHMLALFVDPSHERLRSEMARLQDDRIERAQAMVARLNELGVGVSFERVAEIAGQASVGRPHIAQAMVELGIVRKTPDAFTDEWIGNKGRAYVERHSLAPLEAVALIREAGGSAVLAHPIWTVKDESLTESDIEDLAAAGLAGIEVDHPDHDENARRHYAALAKRLDLVPTGSSDWHGNEHGGMIGSETTDRARLDRLRDRAGRR
ncbi:MAG: PHP domain-containing protein [Actinomycetota bacterium]|nr:PHP domain-containing protein [Actinomycetota bacterium]